MSKYFCCNKVCLIKDAEKELDIERKKLKSKNKSNQNTSNSQKKNRGRAKQKDNSQRKAIVKWVPQSSNSYYKVISDNSIEFSAEESDQDQEKIKEVYKKPLQTNRRPCNVSTSCTLKNNLKKNKNSREQNRNSYDNRQVEQLVSQSYKNITKKQIKKYQEEAQSEANPYAHGKSVYYDDDESNKKLNSSIETGKIEEDYQSDSSEGITIATSKFKKSSTSKNLIHVTRKSRDYTSDKNALRNKNIDFYQNSNDDNKLNYGGFINYPQNVLNTNFQQAFPIQGQNQMISHYPYFQNSYQNGFMTNPINYPNCIIPQNPIPTNVFPKQENYLSQSNPIVNMNLHKIKETSDDHGYLYPKNFNKNSEELITSQKNIEAKDNGCCNHCEEIYKKIIFNNYEPKNSKCSYCHNSLNTNSLDQFYEKYKEDLIEMHKNNITEELNITYSIKTDNLSQETQSVKKEFTIKACSEQNLIDHETLTFNESSTKKSQSVNKSFSNENTENTYFSNDHEGILNDKNAYSLSEYFKNKKLNLMKKLENRKKDKKEKSLEKIEEEQNFESKKNRVKEKSRKKKASLSKSKEFKEIREPSKELIERLTEGRKHHLSSQEIKEINKRMVQILPEVINKQIDEKSKESKMKNREKAKDYAEKIKGNLIGKP